jgi:hypothetical protein
VTTADPTSAFLAAQRAAGVVAAKHRGDFAGAEALLAEMGNEATRGFCLLAELALALVRAQTGQSMDDQYDAGKREVFDHPGIRVMAASPEHVFAMKAFASRGRDEDDLRALAEILGISTVEAALELCIRFFPDEEVSSRTKAMLEDLFASQ